MEIKLNYDQIDYIIREELTKNALDFLDEDYDTNEDIFNKTRMFSSFCDVIKFYSSPKQWDEFKQRLKGNG